MGTPPSCIPYGKCQQLSPTHRRSPRDERKSSTGPQEQGRWALEVPREPTGGRSSPSLPGAKGERPGKGQAAIGFPQ